MRYLGIVFLIINNCVSLGQGIKFKVYLTKACSGVETLDTSYYLLLNGDLNHEYDPKTGITYLPTKGKYLLGFLRGPLLDNPYIEIRDTGLFIFRYKEPEIQRYSSGASDIPPIYVKCDIPVNGYQEDFYPDGKLKMRGKFKSGSTKDSIVTFYPSGKMDKRITVLPKIITIEQFDTLGNIAEITRRQNILFMTYSEYGKTVFFPDGKIKSKESSIKRIIRIEEYYPSGELKIKKTKTSRTEYYSNGLKSFTYAWKYKKDNDIDDKYFAITKNEFNETGQIFKSIVYQEWLGNTHQPDLSITKSGWIISFTKYQNGKEVFRIKDMNTKKFLEKYPDAIN